ncbi:MAG: bifunctional sulfate adenylyltransferase/adenylylsulfate kinase [Gammaproteobacteria bacterium]|nr:bifunctional sulfate adenylyltransferase/adenylylsulfate kinase [Gammaproteobacteria bacterium]
MSDEIPAHGGALVSRVVPPERAEPLKEASMGLPSLTLSLRQLCDLELIANGGFSPLQGFMGEADYHGVLERMRLQSGALWPIPITLEVSEEQANTMEQGSPVALRDNEGFMLAVLMVAEVFSPEPKLEAERIYATCSTQHPEVARLMAGPPRCYLGGTIEAVQLPNHYDFASLRYTPVELREYFARVGWRQVVALHTSKPVHRMQRTLCMEAVKRANAHLLIHPVVGISRPGDVSYYTRVKCYRAVERYFPHGVAMLALLPMAMRMAGPRAALWHAIVRRNYGCSHFVIANDHGSPPRSNEAMRGLFGPYAAQDLVKEHEREVGIEVVGFERQVYSPERRRFVALSEVGSAEVADLYTSEFDRRLAMEEPVPAWYTYPEVIAVLRAANPPRRKMGLTLFFTGLSGAGKSTIAKIVYGKLIEDGTRPVTLLDGDVVRLNLSSELGFSKAHRDLNVRRIGFVAAEITKNRGVAICAPIAPYLATRSAVRETVSEHGAFIEIHVSTPLEVCEARDRKGLYAKARKGLIAEFTGVSDPYEVPEGPEMRIDTSSMSPMEAGEEVYLYLVRQGFIDTGDTVEAHV